MLGEFITRGLLLVLGYAYPAFECFKTVEKNRVEIQELRFWCQYWIIVALLTVLERIGDTFISWVPMYGEMKLALIIYLWYPKTKGTGYVYETLLRPYVANHETDIERNLLELRARAWDLALYYWKNFANLGQSTFFQIIQFLAFQTGKISKANDETADQHLERLANKHKNENHNPTPSAPPLPPAGSSSFSFFGNRRKPPSDHRRRPPQPPQSPGYMFRSMAQAPKSNVVQVNLNSQTGYVHTHNCEELDPSDPRSGLSGSPNESETGVNHGINAARFKLRRSKAFN